MTWNIDATPEEADWIKNGWDFPPYKSKEFNKALDNMHMDLAEFKKCTAYKRAVANGLIKNDKWVGK